MINIPKDKLRQGRIDALAKVKKDIRRKKQWQAITAVAIVFLSFLLSVRVSPTIASYAAKIPGLSVIVELVQENEGIKDAIDNDLYNVVPFINNWATKTSYYSSYYTFQNNLS